MVANSPARLPPWAGATRSTTFGDPTLRRRCSRRPPRSAGARGPGRPPRGAQSSPAPPGAPARPPPPPPPPARSLSVAPASAAHVSTAHRATSGAKPRLVARRPARRPWRRAGAPLRASPAGRWHPLPEGVDQDEDGPALLAAEVAQEGLQGRHSPARGSEQAGRARLVRPPEGGRSGAPGAPRRRGPGAHGGRARGGGRGPPAPRPGSPLPPARNGSASRTAG